MLAGDNKQAFVAVHHRSAAVDKGDTVPVAIESHPQIGAFLHHPGTQGLGLGRTHPFVDVQTIRRGPHDHDAGPQLFEHRRRDVVSGTVGTVDHDGQTAETEPTGHGTLAEFNVAAGGIVNAHHLAQMRRVHRGHRFFQHLLDFQLDGIGQLGAFRRKEFDAIVVVRVVGRADHNPRLRMEGAGEVGDRRCGHRPQHRHIDTGGHQPRLQRGLEHITGDPGILADNEFAAAGTGKHPARGPAQLEDKFRIDGSLPHAAPNTIGAEIVSRHCLFLCCFSFLLVPMTPGQAPITYSRICRASTVSATSWQRTRAAPRSAAITASDRLAARR